MNFGTGSKFWIRRSSADYRGELFPFSRPSKNAQKERFGSDTFWGLAFLAAPLGAGTIFAAFCELEIRYVLGPWDFLCFLGPSFSFFGGVKNLIWGVGKKNAARVMRGLWLGTMMMGASWDILTLHADTPGRNFQWDPKIKQQLHGRSQNVTQKHVHTTGRSGANEPGKHTDTRTSRGKIEFKGGTCLKPCTLKKKSTGQKQVDGDSLVHNTFWGAV